MDYAECFDDLTQYLCLIWNNHSSCTWFYSGPFQSWLVTHTRLWQFLYTTHLALRPLATYSTKVHKRPSSGFSLTTSVVLSRYQGHWYWCFICLFQLSSQQWSVMYPKRLLWFWTVPVEKGRTWRLSWSWRRLTAILRLVERSVGLRFWAWRSLRWEKWQIFK